MIRAVLNSRAALWGLLYIPLVLQLGRFADGQLFYGEILHWTGLQSTRLLIIVLAVTPLWLLFRSSKWAGWLRRRRRDLGVATFFYCATHTVIYLENLESFQAAVNENLQPPLLTGWIALIVFFLLAATSNDYSVRALRGSWKSLHKLVYLGTAFTFAHWILTAFDPTSGYMHLGVVVLLIAIRLAVTNRNRTLRS